MSTGFTSSASVCPTDQVTVLQAIVDKLRADIAAFATESTCFISDVPWPAVEVSDNLFCTVAPRPSEFDGDMPVGAAENGIRENSQVIVTVWSRLQLDRLEHSVLAFTHESRGLLVLKQQVLRSLAGRKIYSDAPANSIPLLTEHLRPLNALHPPLRQGEDDFSSFAIVFEAPFDWDLTPE